MPPRAFPSPCPSFCIASGTLERDQSEANSFVPGSGMANFSCTRAKLLPKNHHRHTPKPCHTSRVGENYRFWGRGLPPVLHTPPATPSPLQFPIILPSQPFSSSPGRAPAFADGREKFNSKGIQNSTLHSFRAHFFQHTLRACVCVFKGSFYGGAVRFAEEHSYRVVIQVQYLTSGGVFRLKAVRYILPGLLLWGSSPISASLA